MPWLLLLLFALGFGCAAGGALRVERPGGLFAGQVGELIRTISQLPRLLPPELDDWAGAPRA